jgi:glycosyltransferase involved in cell wall biosynthesis
LALTVERWESHWMTSHQVLPRLADYFHVSWLQPVHEWRETLAAARAQSRLSQGPHPAPAIVRPAELWLPKVYRPVWLADRLARARLARARAELLARGCQRIVLYVWDPAFAADVGRVPHDLRLYHIVDEYSFAETDEPTDPVERALIEHADEVIVHSPGLLDKKGGINPRTVMIPNGVDYNAFSRPVPEPEDLAAIPHPRIGYAGFIKKQLDWDLLIALARRHPQWSWVFVGAARPHELDDVIAELSALPNVHFLGAKAADVLATYPQHFDVCIMPYRRGDYTQYIYPLKLHEYLAGGRPVVGTRIRSLESFDGTIQLATTADEWSAALTTALGALAQSAQARAGRQAVARAFDWDALVERIAERIQAGLARISR